MTLPNSLKQPYSPYRKEYSIDMSVTVAVKGFKMAANPKEAVQKVEHELKKSLPKAFEKNEGMSHDFHRINSVTVDFTGGIEFDKDVNKKVVTRRYQEELKKDKLVYEFCAKLANYLEVNWWTSFDKKVLVVDFNDLKLATEEYEEYLRLREEFSHNLHVEVFPVINYVLDKDVENWLSKDSNKHKGFTSTSNLMFEMKQAYLEYLEENIKLLFS